MRERWVDNTLTDEERDTFERDGCLVIEDGLTPDMLAKLNQVVDRLDADQRATRDLSGHERVNLHDLPGRDDLLFELMEWPRTFPKVFGIMGWNIQLFHTQMVVSPPLPLDEAERKQGGG